jgi:hypothetical protein
MYSCKKLRFLLETAANLAPEAEDHGEEGHHAAREIFGAPDRLQGEQVRLLLLNPSHDFYRASQDAVFNVGISEMNSCWSTLSL